METVSQYSSECAHTITSHAQKTLPTAPISTAGTEHAVTFNSLDSIPISLKKLTEQQAREANYRFLTQIRPLAKIDFGHYQSPIELQRHRNNLQHYAQ